MGIAPVGRDDRDRFIVGERVDTNAHDVRSAVERERHDDQPAAALINQQRLVQIEV